MGPEEVRRLVRGQQFELDGDTLKLGQVELRNISDGAQWFDPVLKDAMPRSPRGDYRERTVNLLVRDAVEDPGGRKEEDLIGEPREPAAGLFARDQAIAEAGMRARFGQVLDDHYVVVTAKQSKFLFPFHTDLPGNFKFLGRYKMFNGLILAFLCRPGPDGAEFNTGLLDLFYELFNDESELTLLDRRVVQLARSLVGDGDQPPREARADVLIGHYSDELSSHPVLMPEVHRLFQDDVRTALDMRSLGRKDRVAAVLTVFYLHLALYFWRLGYVLEEQASAFLAFLAEPSSGTLAAVERAARPELRESCFRGQIKFRVASSRSRPYGQDDPAMQAYREVDARRLLLLPLNLSLLRLSRLLAGKGDETCGFAEVAKALRASKERRAQFDAGFRVIAWSVSEARLRDEARTDIQRLALSDEPGFVAAREALVKGWRSEFRRSSRDIAAQLMKRGGKGLVATRGAALYYFEIGQELLLLLAKLVTRGEAVPYKTFLARLADYGLAPQDVAEEDELAEVLRSLQLLEKYSDAGESMYVKHFL